MITVKGYRYYTESNQLSFSEKYENLGQWMCDIQNNAYSKDKIYLPARNEDGSFNQTFSKTQSGCLRYYGNDNIEYKLIEMIIDEYGKVLFSSGSRTNGKGHISSQMKEILDGFDEWIKRDYKFAE